jgi:transcriptional regulator with PAS, ATPase and Fis domain
MTEERTEATAVTGDESRGSARLLILVDGAAHTFELPRGDATVGRSRECEVKVEHGSVSRRHATIHIGDTITVEDLGSANGTRVGGKALAPGVRATVSPGTIFEIGKVRAVVAIAPVSRGEVTPMEKTRQLVESVARGTISVLLVGETGAGKEVMAREIHDRSPRAAAPFVAVNCAALPENLLESELFGYEKGAFTGATASKPGLLEAASGGSVLLDEIGDMPPPTQAKILRVLETREVTPLGSVRPKGIDVRFIAATNRNLDSLVAEGRFREDLLFRISGVTIPVPPLRERSHEIARLAEKILSEECERAHKPKRTLSPEAIALLESYRWPGNVRELRSAMERAVLVAETETIGAEHLLLATGRTAELSTPDLAGSDAPASDPQSERARIEAALERCGGNQKEAAKMLGITRRALMYRMDRHGIKRPRKKSGD